MALAAAMALTVTELKIDSRTPASPPALIAAAAAEQKVAPEAFHIQLSAMSRALPTGILGATQERLERGAGTFLEGARTSPSH